MRESLLFLIISSLFFVIKQFENRLTDRVDRLQYSQININSNIMIMLQGFFERFYAMRNNKTVVAVIVFLALIALTSYQFPAAKDRAWSALSSNVLSIFKSGVVSENPMTESELSTVGTELGEAVNKEISAEAGWAIRKSVKGESVWKVYSEMARANSDITLKNQTINGLKNLTILKNKISTESVKSNSLREGDDYSFLSQEAAVNYAKKLSEANKQMQEGKVLKDLSQDLQMTYLLANAPSYQFLSTLQADNLNLLN